MSELASALWNLEVAYERGATEKAREHLQAAAMILDGSLPAPPAPPRKARPVRARSRLGQRLPRPGPARSAIERVARKHGLELADLRSEDRTRQLVHIRWEAMAAARLTGASLSEIGAVLDRDHSTVIYGLRQRLDTQTATASPRTQETRPQSRESSESRESAVPHPRSHQGGDGLVNTRAPVVAQSSIYHLKDWLE